MSPRWFVVKDATGNYYAGGVDSRGRPYCDATKAKALEMDEDDFKADFPKGLPEGWEKEPLK